VHSDSTDCVCYIRTEITTETIIYPLSHAGDYLKCAWIPGASKGSVCTKAEAHQMINCVERSEIGNARNGRNFLEGGLGDQWQLGHFARPFDTFKDCPNGLGGPPTGSTKRMAMRVTMVFDNIRICGPCMLKTRFPSFTEPSPGSVAPGGPIGPPTHNSRCGPGWVNGPLRDSTYGGIWEWQPPHGFDNTHKCVPPVRGDVLTPVSYPSPPQPPSQTPPTTYTPFTFPPNTGSEGAPIPVPNNLSNVQEEPLPNPIPDEEVFRMWVTEMRKLEALGWGVDQESCNRMTLDSAGTATLCELQSRGTFLQPTGSFPPRPGGSRPPSLDI